MKCFDFHSVSNIRRNISISKALEVAFTHMMRTALSITGLISEVSSENQGFRFNSTGREFFFFSNMHVKKNITIFKLHSAYEVRQTINEKNYEITYLDTCSKSRNPEVTR